MGLLDFLKPKKRIENPENPLTPSLIQSNFKPYNRDISPDGALQLAVVYACVRVIAETIASLPINVFEKQEKGKKKATDHQVYRLLHDEPNEYMTPCVLWDYIVTSVLMTGNAYIYVERDNANRPLTLTPIDPNDIQVKRISGQKLYQYKSNQYLTDEDVVHIHGISYDGLVGISPIKYAATAINCGIATDIYGLNYFANGTHADGFYSSDGAPLKKEQLEAFQETMQKYKGVDSAHERPFFPFGVKFNPLTINNEDSQFLQSKRFTVEEVCRIFKVPPHMVQSLERATFNNIEQQSLDFYQNTIRPWLVRIEQQLNRKLFSNGERYKYVCEFNLNGLLRADLQARYASYATARQWGWMSVNDIRELENMNPIDGGDEYLVPANMNPTDGPKPATPAAPAAAIEQEPADEGKQ